MHRVILNVQWKAAVERARLFQLDELFVCSGIVVCLELLLFLWRGNRYFIRGIKLVIRIQEDTYLEMIHQIFFKSVPSKTIIY